MRSRRSSLARSWSSSPSYAAGPLGKARVLGRRPTNDVAWIDVELARVGEVAGLFRRGDRLLAEPIPDVTLALGRLRIEGSVLEGRELAALHRVLVASRQVHADLRRVAEQAPLAAALDRPVLESRIERRLEQSVDAEGLVLDTASPRLAAARREVHAARQRLLRKLESLLRGLDTGAAPSDAGVTVRGGRYVIPVRRDSRARPSGIIHDESGSAGTLFIEPSEAIELGNALREAEVEEERETLRVLRELTDLLRPELSALRDVVEMCVAVDDLVARARYAVAVEGEVPDGGPAPSLAGHRTRASSAAALRQGTGCALRPRARLTTNARCSSAVPTPAARPCSSRRSVSRLPWPRVGSFRRSPRGADCRCSERFYADIGDRQSIAASLSTFSAHVANAPPDPGPGGRCDSWSCSTRSAAEPIRPKVPRSRRQRWSRSPSGAVSLSRRPISARSRISRAKHRAWSTRRSSSTRPP